MKDLFIKRSPPELSDFESFLLLNPLNSDAVEAVSGTVYEMGRGNKAKKKWWRRRDVMTREGGRERMQSDDSQGFANDDAKLVYEENST